jgi:arylsulfatase A-like enzyme
MNAFVCNGTVVRHDGNKATAVTSYAQQFLNAASAHQPFFLVIGYDTTHSPYAGHDPEFLDLYKNATFGDLPAYTPHPWHQNEDFPQGDDFTYDDCRERYAEYYAAVTEVDRNVGEIVQALSAQAGERETRIIYTADHGLALGHQGFWGKGNSTRPLNMYEASIRIPLIVASCDVGRERRLKRSVDHWDTFQTVVDWARPGRVKMIDSDRNYPGRSYRPLVDGNRYRDWRDTRYGEYGDLRMIRTPGAKLIRRYPTGPDELFDLKRDPVESTSVNDRPEFARARRLLQRRLEQFFADHEDPRKSGLRVKQLRRHNERYEAWRDGIRERRGLQVPLMNCGNSKRARPHTVTHGE